MHKLVVSLALVVALVGAVSCASDGVSFADRRAEISERNDVDPFPGVDATGDVAMPFGRSTKTLAPERQRFVDGANARIDGVVARIGVFADAVAAADLDSDVRDDATKAAADLRAEAIALRNHVKDDVVAATDATWDNAHDRLSAKLDNVEKRIDDLETQLAAR